MSVVAHSQSESVVDDPVVVYDVMREAANRVVALLSERVTVGGAGDPMIQKMHEVDDVVAAVPTHDVSAQRAATVRFRRQYEQLLAEQ